MTFLLFSEKPITAIKVTVNSMGGGGGRGGGAVFPFLVLFWGAGKKKEVFFFFIPKLFLNLFFCLDF